jgi:hypothetical protein
MIVLFGGMLYIYRIYSLIELKNQDILAYKPSKASC